MDRLHPLSSVLALSTLVTLTIGCDDGTTSAAPPSRVVAVAADPTRGPSVDDFCDVEGSGPNAAEMIFPELVDSVPPNASGARWVNVWATWCAPCVEEIPRLLEFRDRLREDGADVDLVFLSADGDGEAVAAFQEEHSFAQAGPRIADPAALPAWATRVGLDEGATLPIHLFVDAGNRIRCARTGGVQEEHYELVKTILGH